jgi:hypothetical protein
MLSVLNQSTQTQKTTRVGFFRASSSAACRTRSTCYRFGRGLLVKAKHSGSRDYEEDYDYDYKASSDVRKGKTAHERMIVRASSAFDDPKQATPDKERVKREEEEERLRQRKRPGAQVLERERKETDDDDVPDGSSFPELDYLQELMAIQKDCPKEIGFFGTRNMGFLHQQLIEILAYALCLTGNHIFTSGATGTNAAVIRGSLRAERPELLTVVLPQSLSKQPAESRELLENVRQVQECPENDHLPLLEASRICNDVIVSKVRQVICFAFHDSTLLLDTCREAKAQRKMVTLFYLD